MALSGPSAAARLVQQGAFAPAAEGAAWALRAWLQFDLAAGVGQGHFEFTRGADQLAGTLALTGRLCAAGGLQFNYTVAQVAGEWAGALAPPPHQTSNGRRPSAWRSACQGAL